MTAKCASSVRSEGERGLSSKGPQPKESKGPQPKEITSQASGEGRKSSRLKMKRSVPCSSASKRLGERERKGDYSVCSLSMCSATAETERCGLDAKPSFLGKQVSLERKIFRHRLSLCRQSDRLLRATWGCLRPKHCTHLS